MRQHLTNILGLDTPRRVGIIGAGNLGTALANYNGFRESNFEVVALFDNDREKIGRRVGDAKIVVHDVRRVERIVREEGIDVAVIAVPAREAQKVLNQVTAAGVKAVMMVYDRPPFAIVGRRSRGITGEVASLKRRRLGAPERDAAFAQWPVFKTLNGIDEKEWAIRIETVGFPVREPLLAQGEVDAVFGYAMTAAVGLKAEAVSGRTTRGAGLPSS